MSGRRIAAFDFDGTITRHDTLLPFLAAACGRRRVARTLAELAPAAARGRTRPHGADEMHPRDALKEDLLRRLLGGRDEAWYHDEGRRFAAALPRRIRPEMSEQIHWHRQQGHELVLVSASLATYLDPLAERLGFDHVIAVTMAVGPDGNLTGELARPNVRGPEKAHRLLEWLGGEKPTFLWAYGNSTGDRELLALADVPVWLHSRPPR